MQQTIKNKKIMSTSSLVKIGILSAIGYILMFISMPLPMLFPEFLRIDISDITALLGGITLGPVAGVTIAFLKNLLQFLTGMSMTGGIGELANFMIGGSFVWVASFLYSKKHNTRGLIIGLIFATITMIIVGGLANYFIILPFYSTIMPIETVIDMGAKINPVIVDKISFIIWIIAPFNLLKASLMSVMTLLVYKKVEKILK